MSGKHRSEPDYIDRTIETVRQHRNAENCWPSWASIFADEIEDLRADLAEAQKKVAMREATITIVKETLTTRTTTLRERAERAERELEAAIFGESS